MEEPVRTRPNLIPITRGAAPAPAPANPTSLADLDAPYTPPQNTVVAKKTTPTEQISLRFGEEDRGRFKDTEPALVQGEDLDVPTWMRLKRKLKK